MEKYNIFKSKLSDYTIYTTLGTGSFGRVKLAKNKNNGKYYAFKMLKKAEIIRSMQVDHVVNENQILRLLNHPFIIKIEGFCQDSRYLYFILEFVPGGQLFAYLRKVQNLQINHAVIYAAQVTLIFQYLHSKNIIYRDLKPQNLLIGEDGYLKLTDFGFSKIIQDRTFTLCGTPEYLAPEILLNKGHGKPVDWWTLGILIYQMIAGIDPFSDDDPLNIYQNILKGKIRYTKEFDNDSKLIIKNLLVADLTQRYGNLKGGVEDIKQHSWFKNIDWKNLINKKSQVYYKPIIKNLGDTSNFEYYPQSDNKVQSIGDNIVHDFNLYIYTPDFKQMSLSNLRLVKQLFINGKFVDSKLGKTFDVINPSTQEKITTIQEATNQDVDLAVSAARKAFDHGPWTRMTPDSRAMCLFKLAELIQNNLQDLARVQSLNNGKPWNISKVADLYLPHKCYRYYAGWVDKIKGSVFPMHGPFLSYTSKQPVGVVGQIIPWNFPLLMQAWKLAPALAAGCTVVMKTAQQTPLSALRVSELISQSGFPNGVVNILSGFGQVGSYLSQHKDIDKVAFTGSTQIGYHIIRNSHKHNLKRVTLQLSGKSPNIITQFADLQKAVRQSSVGSFFNAGQCCIAGSRVFVHQKIYDQYVRRVTQAARNIKVGDPFDESTMQGPLISRQKLDRVLRYIEIGKQEGAKLVLGGNRIGNKGFFIEPTIFTDVTDNMTIARQEIFGPVMCIFKYKNTQEVLKRANDSCYGLGAGVVTQNFDQAQLFARKIKAGTVYINCYNVFDSTTPFGGYKDSGLGRQLGEQGINTYLETKTIIHHREEQ